MILHHVYLVCPGATAEEVRRFYVDGLGLTEVEKNPALANLSIIWFGMRDGSCLHVAFPAQGQVGGHHVAFGVDDLDSARARLEKIGRPVEDHVLYMGYPRFTTSDPWGNQFEILPASIERIPGGLPDSRA